MQKGIKILMTLMGLEIGGAETHVVELSKELKRMGYNIVIASNGGVYEKELEESGIKHYDVPLNNKNPYNIIKSYFLLKRIIIEEKIDIVHAHARIPAFLCGLLHRKMKFPFITTAHWVFNTSWGLKYITNWGQKTIAVSDDIKEYLLKHYHMSERDITVTVNGIDTEKFAPDVDVSGVYNELSLKKDAIRIVYVSRLDTDRSEVAYRLLEISQSLIKKVPDLEIIIVGSGNEFNKLNLMADEINNKIGNRFIVMTGPRTDINRFTALADVFIGVSRAALEAMAAKRPVIIAGNEGYIGIFDEDKLESSILSNFTCRGLQRSSNEKLENDIIKLINEMDKEKRKELGEYGKQVILERYSVSKMAGDNAHAYSELLIDNDSNRVVAENVNDKAYDVMISGYYGFKNSGDDALLMAIIDNLRLFKNDIKIIVLSMNPGETKRVYGVDAINRFNIFSIIPIMKKTKLLINGGGSLIQDITSTQSLLYYLSIIWLAKKLGLKVMVYANGIGPVKRRLNRKITHKIINEVDFITLREEGSENELHNMGITKPPIKVTADPAVTLSPAADSEIDEILIEEQIDLSRPLVGFSIRDWKGEEKRYSEVIAKAADYLADKYEVCPVFIPMQYPKDVDIAKKIVSQMNQKGYIVKNKYTVAQTLGIINKMNLIIGMRLHALIYAATLGVPLIGIVYEQKVEGFLKYARQASAGDIKDLTFEKLRILIDDTFEARERIKPMLIEITTKLKGKAIENAEIAVELLRNGENYEKTV